MSIRQDLQYEEEKRDISNNRLPKKRTVKDIIQSKIKGLFRQFLRH